MEYHGILLTGTSGAGKSTIARKLCEKHNVFEVIKTVTTRQHSNNDTEGEYEYLSDNEFRDLRDNNGLAIYDQYGNSSYGIKYESILEAISNKHIPILLVNSKSSRGMEQNGQEQNGQFIMQITPTKKAILFSIFLDASDDTLDERITNQGRNLSEDVRQQRIKDRIYEDGCIYNIKNTANIDDTVELISSLWDYRLTGGVLPARLIKLMIKNDMLLKDANLDNISGAAYDLSLGDEYYYAGRIKLLTDSNPFILIEPYDYAIVTSRELSNLPRDIAGRFDLTVSLFCQGIILSNGPQVDPGFRGRLFCLLFNTSNGVVPLKRGQHYSTIEFSKLIEPTRSYNGKYQDKDKIIHYLPSNSLRGAINELKKEIEGIKRENRVLISVFLGVTSLVVAIIALLLLLK